MHKLGLIMCKSHVIGVFMPPKLHNFLFQAFDAFLSSTQFRYRLFPFPCDKIHAWFSKHLMYRWPLLNRHQVNDWLVSNIMRGKYQKNDQLVYDLFDPDRDVIAIWTGSEAGNSEIRFIFMAQYTQFDLDLFWNFYVLFARNTLSIYVCISKRR